MMDVYHEVDKYLIERNFYNATVEEQKELIQEGLKEYVLRKIGKIDLIKGMNLEKKKAEISLEDLVAILGELIPKEKHFDTLRHLTHYILNVAGEMQRHSIIWYEENEPGLINNPEIRFNKDGKWESITCHKDTSYVQTFSFANQIFKEEFKNNHKENKSLILTATQEKKE